MKNFNALHISVLTIAILLTSACGKVGEELNPTWRVRVSNPAATKLRCLQEVDGASKTIETSEKEIVVTAEQANTFLYISCQKMGKDASKIEAFLMRNDGVQESDECAVDFCIVSASGVTK